MGRPPLPATICAIPGRAKRSFHASIWLAEDMQSALSRISGPRSILNGKAQRSISIFGSEYRECPLGFETSGWKKKLQLQRRFAPLIVADADRLVNLRHEDLAIADLARARCADDGLDGLLF